MTEHSDYLSSHFSSLAEKAAKKLRDMADEVEREAAVKEDVFTGKLSHMRSAQNIVHVVTWGVANLHLDTIMSVACEADEANKEET